MVDGKVAKIAMRLSAFLTDTSKNDVLMIKNGLDEGKATNYVSDGDMTVKLAFLTEVF